MINYQHLLFPVRVAADVPTPAAGQVELFLDSVSLHLSQKDATGLVTDLVAGASLTSPDGNTYTRATNAGIEWVVDGHPAGGITYDAGLGMTKVTIPGALDPPMYIGTPQTIAQRDALVATSPATKGGYLVYVKDTGVNEYQVFDGAAWNSVGAANAVSSTSTQLIVRADAVKGVVPDTTEWPAPKDTDRAIVVLTDKTQEFYEYQTDKFVLLETITAGLPDQPGDFFGAASTFATLPTTLTRADSTVLNVGFGDYVELIKDDGTNKAGYYQWTGSAYVLNTALNGTPLATTTAAGVVQLAADSDIVSGTAGRIVDAKQLKDALAAIDISGQYIGSAATFATLPTTKAGNGDWAALSADDVGTGTAANPQYKRGVYVYNGTSYSFAVALDAVNIADATTTTKGLVQLADAAAISSATIGRVVDAAQLKAVAPNARKFAPATGAGSVTVATAGKPTAAEIKTWAAAQNPKVIDALVYYTGTAIAADTPTYVFDVDTAGEATTLEVPASTGLAKNGILAANTTLTKEGVYGYSGNGLASTSNVNYLNTDFLTETMTGNTGWGNYTIGLDPTSNYGAPPVGKVVKFRIRRLGTTDPVQVRLYSNNGGSSLVASSALTGKVNLGSDVTEYTLVTPFNVTAGTQMLAVELGGQSVYTDIRTGYTIKYATGSGAPTANQSDRYSAVQFVIETSVSNAPLNFKLPASATLGANTPLFFHEVDNIATNGAVLSCATGDDINGTVNGTFAMNAASGIFMAIADGAGGYAVKQVGGAPVTASATSLHDAGQGTRLPITVSGTSAHLEGGAGYTLTAAGLPDAFACRVINTTTAAQTVALSGYAGAYLRDGSGTVTNIGATLSVPANTVYDVYSDKNGANVYLNVKPGSAAAVPTALSTALSLNGEFSLQCTNSWLPRSIGNIGDTSKDFAAPDASFHYKALRDMIIDVSATCMSSEGNGLTIGIVAQLFRANTWVDVWTPIAKTNSSAGVVPFHNSAQIAIKANEYFRILTNANDGGNNTYPGQRNFRIGINESPSLTLMPANTTILTQRSITGSVTSVGYDNVELPYQIPLAVDKVLDTVTLNGTATTNFDANTGMVRIKPNGGNVAVAHTTKNGATFNSPQTVSRLTGLATNLTATATNVDFGTTLQEGDEIVVYGDYNNDAGQGNQFTVPYVRAGATIRAVSWPATDHLVNFGFPATLTNTVSLTHGGGNTTFRMRGYRVRRDAANKTVVPTGTTVATAYPITVNGGTNGSFTGHEGIGPETFYLTMPVDQEIDAFPAVAGVNLRNRQAGMISVDRGVGAGALALTGITFRAMAPNSQYFGTWDNQAGDSGATNGGHTCTRRLLRGTGITTANDSVLTLSGGVYKVRMGVIRHQAYGTWRVTGLLVNGATVETIYSGHDGSNWPGGSVLEWVVDATSANQTVQARRINSTGNGNCAGFLSVERVTPAVAPDGTKIATPYTLTINGGANGTFTGYEGIGAQTFFLTNMPANNRIDAFPTVAGCNVLSRLLGAITVDRAIGGGNLDLTGITFASQETYQGLNLIGQFLPANNTVYDTLASVTTGIDFTRCSHIEAVGRQTSDARATSSFIPVIIGGTTPTMEFQFSGGQMSCYIANNADALIGKLTNVDCHGIAFETTAIRGWSMGPVGYSVPTATVLFTPRNITGTGITATVGRDNTVSTIRITGITPGSEIIPGNISASGGATVNVVNSGRSGTATVDVIPNGADTVITYTQTVWRRTVTAVNAAGGAAVNVDNAATKNVDATTAQVVSLTLTANNYLSNVTATGAVITGFTGSGNVAYVPDNTANVVLTATFAPSARDYVFTIANSGIDLTLGNFKIRLNSTTNRAMMISTVSGTATLNGETNYFGPTGHSFQAVNNLAVTTTPVLVFSGWSFGNANDTQRFVFKDGGGGLYECQMRVGSAYNNNSLSIFKLN